MSTKKKMLTAIFRDRVSTEHAFDWLQERGYDSGEISVLMSEHTRKGYHDHGTEGRIKTGSHAMEGVAAGGAVGTVVGATVGAILALKQARFGLIVTRFVVSGKYVPSAFPLVEGVEVQVGFSISTSLSAWSRWGPGGIGASGLRLRCHNISDAALSLTGTGSAGKESTIAVGTPESRPCAPADTAV